jgi:hypothetical protein
MPPYFADSTPLLAIANTLHDIANAIAHFAELGKAAAGREGSHETPLTQISESLDGIKAEIAGLGGPGDHSSTYERIEGHLKAMAKATESMSGK